MTMTLQLRRTLLAVNVVFVALSAGVANAQENEAKEAIEESAQEATDGEGEPGAAGTAATASGYAETVSVAGGDKSVTAELVSADADVVPLLDIDVSLRFTDWLKERKHRFNSRTGIAFSVDYTFLAQQASSSLAEKDAASDVFRIFGNWMAFGDILGTNGSLVFKYEHRAAIWGRQTPRDLGFATGSALSTANYKENGWGWTDFYWKHILYGGKVAIIGGHMDPGDWADQHSLLNAWTNLLNDAFYNNPSEAIPKRTFSVVTRVNLGGSWYGGFGIHDANGKDNHIDFKQVWDTPELFTWVEIGRHTDESANFGETTHLHYWHQDQRVEAGVEESWGLAASRSQVHDNGYTTVFRLGYSEGDAAQMRRFVGAAVSRNVRVSDNILVGIGWGSPPDKSLGNQTVLEAMYHLQLTNSVVVSPDLQVTFNPSFDQTTSVVYVFGFRFRLVF